MNGLRLLCVSSFLVFQCNASGADDALLGALRWYYRWIANLPAAAGSINCKIATLSVARFAYCEPDDLNIDIDTPLGSPASVSSLTQESQSFPAALTDFLKHRYSGRPHIPPVRQITIPKSSISKCRVDLEKTRQFEEIAVGPTVRKDLENRGFTLRFPLACEGDPFYLVYFMKGRTVQWVWQIKPGVGPIWSYDRQNEQRKIPDLAIRNLARPAMWYAPLQ